jgi:hypothetical protein
MTGNPPAATTGAGIIGPEERPGETCGVAGVPSGTGARPRAWPVSSPGVGPEASEGTGVVFSCSNKESNSSNEVGPAWAASSACGTGSSMPVPSWPGGATAALETGAEAASDCSFQPQKEQHGASRGYSWPHSGFPHEASSAWQPGHCPAPAGTAVSHIGHSRWGCATIETPRSIDVPFAGRAAWPSQELSRGSTPLVRPQTVIRAKAWRCENDSHDR